MQFYSIWPYFLGMPILLALASSPIFAAADAPHSVVADRIKAMDGLRGFLALAVVFCHIAIYHGYLETGRFDAPAARFYLSLGAAGVSMFFMITGYLFWAKLLKNKGKPAWDQLYIGRAFRLGPLYLVAVIAMLLTVAVLTRFRLNVSVQDLLVQVAAWLALGSQGGGPEVNGYSRTYVVLANVTWTLAYEWKFYFALFALGLLARRKTMHLPCISVALTICLVWMALHPTPYWPAPAVSIVALFLFGMLCASLHEKMLIARVPDRLSSLAVTLLAIASFVFPVAYNAGPVVCLGVAFYLIASGCTVFGLLLSRPARRLGDISYGIYLLQGFPLAALFRTKQIQAFSLASPTYHWTIGICAAVLLIALATAAHVYIERPGIELGRRLSEKIRERSRPATSGGEFAEGLAG